MPWFEKVTDLTAGAEALRRRRYGVIEVTGDQLVHIRLRPFPKFVWLHEPFWGDWYHRHAAANRCRLYYNQPRGFSDFLALKYVLSSRGATLATLRKALDVLDQVAQIKGSCAILCDAANFRISPRLLARESWEPNKPTRWHRNYIKRLSHKDEGLRTKYEVRDGELVRI